MNPKRLFRRVRRLFGQNDGFYLLELYAKALFQHKKGVTTRLVKTVSPPLYENNLLSSEEGIREAVAYENSLESFTEEEILAFDQGVTLALLKKLAAVDFKEKEKALSLFENAITTLRSLESADREERYLRLSALDTYLREHDPIYTLSDPATQNDLKGRIAHFAKKKRLSQMSAAALFIQEKSNLKKPSPKGALFFVAIYLFSFLLTLATFFLGVPLLLLPLVFFPVLQLVKGIMEELLRRTLPSHPIPRIKLDKIPREGMTAVVITTLLTAKNTAPFKRLERFYLANRDENLRFGLLLDLADAPHETVFEDEELTTFAEEEINRLNEKYGNFFFLALRKRSYSPSEKAYIGRERKRGAIIDLVRFMKKEDTPFSLFVGDEAFLQEAVYLVTLDADTDLFMDSVKKMVGAMLHPENRPVIKQGAVRKGYGILQPRMAVSVESASRSRFSLLFCGSGGTDPYATAAFDTYQNLFGEGIFCGKGIIDIAAFHALIPGAFEENRILSHDLLEGNLLRAGFLSDVVLTDSFPKNPLSYYTRAHRWYRGDLQALPYAMESPKNALGKRHKNPVGALARYKIFDNLRRLLTPVASLLALGLSLLFSARAQFAVSLLVTLPWVLPLVFSVFQRNKKLFRRYFSRILQGFGYRFLNTLFSIFSLAHEGLLACNALVKSSYRMLISKRKLLEWTPAERADKKENTALGYLFATVPGQLCGILLLTFAKSALLRLLALSFLVFPLLLVLLAHEFSEKPKALSAHEKARLSRYVFDAWGFFDKLVTEEENYLPPDNYQITPVKALAHRTSPTNIGMYLASCLAARDFGIIDSKELLARTANTLVTLEKLPKKYGHLYNWYDTKTLALLGQPFISFVDSGNLAVSLVALIAGLKDYAEEEPPLCRIAFRYEKLLEAMDFRALYCEKRRLFYIARGSDDPSPSACYDLYMSEARSASYYAVATGAVPKKHWEKLSRVVVGKGRYTGLASWSGTTFEYFMPHLFLPIPKSSLSEEALAFAVNCQKKKKTHGFFGISESAYYAFDADMNYQYRAHGIDILSLDASVEEKKVYSPYSAFLMLPIAPHAALSSLDAFRAYGAYGEFGFFEAVDFAAKDKDSVIIKSFMSHHVGMSILAAANASFDNIFVKRFMKDPRMAMARELLEERIPVDAPVFSGKIKPYSKASPRPLFRTESENKLKKEKNSDRLPKIALFSNRVCHLAISSTGNVELSYKNIALSYPTLSQNQRKTRPSSLRLVFAHGGRQYTVTPDIFSYSGTKAVFESTKDKLTVKVAFTLHGEKNLFGINFSASGVQEPITPTLLFEPILATKEAFLSHPFYRGLSIEASLDKEAGILFFFCRPREEESEKWLALSVEAEGELCFDTRKDILPFGYDEEDLAALASQELPCRLGATLSPFAVLKKTLTPRMGKVTADFLIAIGNSQKEARDTILSVRKKGVVFDILAESLRPITRRLLRSLGDDRPDGRYRELYLSAITYPEKSAVKLKAPTDRKILWQASLSGDLPIIAIAPAEEESDGGTRLVRIMIKMHRLMRDMGVKSDLVFLCRESDNYHQPITKRIGQLLSREGASGYLSKKGGVFLVSDPALIDTIAALSSLYIPLDQNTSPEELYYRITGRRQKKAEPPNTRPEEGFTPTVPQGALRITGGYFSKNSFTVIKSEVDTPRSFVYASSVFGTLLSASSPGFTWLGNSKEKRLTAPSDDLLCDYTEERILAKYRGKEFDLLAMAHTVEYEEGAAIYRGTLDSLPYWVKVGVDRKLPVKLVLAELPAHAELLYRVTPSFGVPPHLRHITEEQQEGKSRFYYNLISPYLSDRVAFLSPVKGEDTRQGYLFGVFPWGKEALYHLIRKKYRDTDAIESGFLEYASSYRNLFSALHFSFPVPELDVLMNRFIPYQSYCIRMLGRTGYHQSSGAYGFRDQLQDALSMLYYDERIVKRQILRAAAHQYKEGDVQHWWHPIPSENGMGAGVRTRISDDMLWLPYAVSEYLKVTKDHEILSLSIAYLDSPPLAEGENDRFESPPKTHHKESLYRHCMRAIDASYQLSERGLPLIGGGDWNDAFNRVGILGKGESIFLGRFMEIVFRNFAKVALLVKDNDSAALLEKRATALAEAIERYAWEGDRYLRGSYDSGAPLGSKHAKECRLDIMAQSFSALAEGANDRTREAMYTAYTTLFDRENKLLKLFDPPFSSRKQEAGYIAAYCEGFRENGGQYNHGALFAVRALYALGEKRKAFEVLSGINPCLRSLSPKTAKAYRSEPYALCGDIYTNPEHTGRGGWSLYTGAAGWFFRTVLECLIGYSEKEDYFTLTPALCDKMPSATLKLSRKNTVYHISLSLAAQERCILDGKKHENKFLFDGGIHILEMDIEKEEKM